MTDAPTQHNRDEISRRGQEVHARAVVPKLRTEDHGRFVVLDIVSEDYEIDPDDYTASKVLCSRRPEGHFYLMLAGYRTPTDLRASDDSGRIQRNTRAGIPLLIRRNHFAFTRIIPRYISPPVRQ